MIELGLYPFCMAVGLLLLAAWVFMAGGSFTARAVAVCALLFFAMAALVILGDLTAPATRPAAFLSVR
ncbi:MAG: hypothetical protein ACREDE_09545 [Thermoplasmata archaeon]